VGESELRIYANPRWRDRWGGGGRAPGPDHEEHARRREEVAARITDDVRTSFREAFAEAAASLEAQERNVLRLNLVHGVSIDRIGLMYGAHRTTAARWVERARQRLESGTRERMVRRLGISESECGSLLKLVWSRLDASAERLLGGG
jgi:RNA polymerase sigma-70 factor (ECF subfamily)